VWAPQAIPMVRVAVEAARQQDMPALERGLAKLYQADPAIEISVQARPLVDNPCAVRWI
jgi:translation elongation factor EF-G